MYETLDQLAEIEQLEAEMKTAAVALEFERAAQLRDRISVLRAGLAEVTV
ncbi:MAG: UvrB/UvrC motif-containing protein [Anaerolineales bacterium]|nr:UvrB/UvrC motif-containing protein [Anaerolineales bacterium]